MLEGYAPYHNFLLFASIAMAALYFKELILIHSILIDAGILAVFIFSHKAFLGEGFSRVFAVSVLYAA